jgi:hypothetical protein
MEPPPHTLRDAEDVLAKLDADARYLDPGCTWRDAVLPILARPDNSEALARFAAQGKPLSRTLIQAATYAAQDYAKRASQKRDAEKRNTTPGKGAGLPGISPERAAQVAAMQAAAIARGRQ